MAVGDCYNLDFQGTACGVPFNFALAYVETTTPTDTGIPPLQALIEAWFNDPVGAPWETVRDLVTTDFNIECVVGQSTTGASQVFFPTDAAGLADPPSLPTTHSYQVNTPPNLPNVVKRTGWFFLPAVPVANVTEGTYTIAAEVQLRQMAQGILFTDQTANGPAGGAFRLMPHWGWREVAQGGPAAEARWATTPFAQLWPKRLQDRRTDSCQAFLSGNLPSGIPIPTPPAPGP